MQNHCTSNEGCYLGVVNVCKKPPSMRKWTSRRLIQHELPTIVDYLYEDTTKEYGRLYEYGCEPCTDAWPPKDVMSALLSLMILSFFEIVTILVLVYKAANKCI